MVKSGKIMFQIEGTANARALSGEHYGILEKQQGGQPGLSRVTGDAVKEVKGKCKSHRGPITHVKTWLVL